MMNTYNLIEKLDKLDSELQKTIDAIRETKGFLMKYRSENAKH